MGEGENTDNEVGKGEKRRLQRQSSELLKLRNSTWRKLFPGVVPIVVKFLKGSHQVMTFKKSGVSRKKKNKTEINTNKLEAYTGLKDRKN